MSIIKLLFVLKASRGQWFVKQHLYLYIQINIDINLHKMCMINVDKHLTTYSYKIE